MAFTYDLSGSGTSLLVSKVRLLIPDNTEKDSDLNDIYELEDDEIEYFLTERGSNVKAATIDACLWLARKYAKQFSFSADGVRAELGQRAEMFAKRAQELRGSGVGVMALERQDGYQDEADDSEYESRTVYVKV